MKNKSIIYLGHSAVLINIGGKTVAIDPWLRGNPLCPAAYQDPANIDIIVLTHGHSDHAGDAIRVAKIASSQVCANYELGMILINEGLPSESAVLMNKGGTVTIDSLSITLTHAFHSSSYDSTKGTLYAGEPCGVVLQAKDWCVYHAGDTALFSDMKLIGEVYKPDIALLPIGDRFTMGPREAASAAKIVGCQMAIPIHYKTFDMLTGTYKEFHSECSKQGVETVELEIGKEMSF